MNWPFLSRFSFRNRLRRKRKAQPHVKKPTPSKVRLYIEALEIRELPSANPTIVAVLPADGTVAKTSTPTLAITYSEAVNATQADNPANYLLFDTTTGQQISVDGVTPNDLNTNTNPNTVTSVTLAYNGNSPLTAGTYTLFVRGDQIEDLFGHFMAAPGQLAVANSGSNTVSLINVGSDGSVGALGNYPDFVNAQATPVLVAFGDFDGLTDALSNPIPDLVVVNQGTDTLSIFQGQAGGGYRLSANTTLALPAGAAASGIVVGDFNNDGLPDIAVADSGTNEVTVFLNTRPLPAVGQLQFDAGTSYAAGNAPSAIVAADFLQNGNLDLAVTDNTADVLGNYDVSVLTGTGLGTFNPAKTFVVGTTAGVGLANPTSLADGTLRTFNNHPDLVVGGTGGAATYGLAVLVNTSGGPLLNFAAANILVNNGPAVTMPVTSVAVGFVDSTPIGSPFASPGIAATTGGNASQLLLFQNDGTATFLAAPTSIDLNAPATSVTLQDLNGDSLNDIVVANNTAAAPGSVMVLLNTSTGTNVTYTAPQVYSVPGVPVSLALGDTNQDGTLDLVTANSTSNDVSLFLGNPNGTFRVSTDLPLPANSTPVALATGDLNGDGLPDMVVVNQNTNSISVYLATGPGTYGAAQVIPVGTSPSAVAIGDFLHNGSNDIAVVNQADSTVTVLLNNGSGTSFTPATYNVGNSPTGIAVGDFNGDGFPDLAVSHNGVNPGISVLLNHGDGTFDSATEVGSGTAAAAIVTADFNKDGFLDLAVINDQPAGQVTIFSGDGQGGFQQTGTFATIDDPTSLAVGDINRDGYPDLVVGGGSSGGTTTGNVGVLLNQNGTGFSASVNTTIHDPRTVIGNVVVTDISQDAYPDVVVTIASETTTDTSGNPVAVTPVNNLFVLSGNGDGTFGAPLPYLAGGMAAAPSIAGVVSDPLVRASTFQVISTGISADLVRNGNFSPSTFNSAEGYFTGWNTFAESGSRGEWAAQDLSPKVDPSGASFSPVSMTQIPSPATVGQTTAAVLDEADLTFFNSIGLDVFAQAYNQGPGERQPITQSMKYPGLAGTGVAADYQGTNVLYQDFTIPTTTASLTFSMSLLLQAANPFTNPSNSSASALTFTNPNADQQVRIDLMDPSANMEDIGSGVLVNLFQTTQTTPTNGGYIPVIVNLTPLLASLAGKTVRLRVAEVTNQGKLIVGMTNVAMNATFTDNLPPTITQLRLRNPGYGVSGSSAGTTSDQTIEGQVVSTAIGSPNDISFVALDTTGSGTFAGPGTIQIAANQLDASGNFSVDLTQFIPGGLVPGTHTIDVEAVDIGGLSYKTSLTFTVQGPSNSAWQAQGPGPILTAGTGVLYPTVSGDVQVVAADPLDPTGNTIYIGAANGGVWKTTDGGQDWTPLTDSVFDSLGNPVPEDIGGLAIGASAGLPAGKPSNVIYAATGVFSFSFYAQAGEGILKSTDAGQTWTLVGQNVFAGARVSTMVVDPTNVNTVYVAVVSGGQFGPGVYGSTNGGNTWANLTLPTTMDEAGGGTLAANGVNNVASVTSLVINPFNPEDLLLGMGNVGFAPNSAAAGVWQTVNHGGTWNQVIGGANPAVPNDTIPAGTTGASIGRVTVALGTGTAADAGVWYVLMASPPLVGAIVPPGTATPTNVASGFMGLYKSSNGGLDWTQVELREDLALVGPLHNWVNLDVLTSEADNFQSLVVDPSDPGVVYLGGADRYRTADIPISGGGTLIDPNNAAFLMVDTRQMVDPTVPQWNGMPANSGDSFGEALEAYPTATFDNGDAYAGVGVYWVNLEYNYSGTNFFGVNSSLTPLLPSGINSLVFDGHGRLLVGTASGIYEGINYGFVPATSTDEAPINGNDFQPPLGPGKGHFPNHTLDLGIPQFIDINGNLQIANLTSVAIDPTNPNSFFTSEGDTGTSRNTGTLTWQPLIPTSLAVNPNGSANIPSAAWVRISPPDPTIPDSHPTVYVTWQFADRTTGLQVDVSHTGGTVGSFQLADSGIRTQSDIPGQLPVLAVNSPLSEGELIFGTQSVYETDTAAGTWDTISPIAGIEPGAYITAAAVSGNDVFYVGTNTGHVYVTQNNGADNFPNESTGLPGATINGLTIDPNNPLLAYAMVGGIGVTHVWMTSNGGKSWTSISNGLPDVPAFSMAIDPQAVPGAPNGRLYLGTQVGVFISNDRGQTWSLIGQGMPHAPVVDLEFDPKSKELAAAVQGRGVFTISTEIGGPYVTSTSPTTPPGAPLTSVTVNFNEPVNPATLVIDAEATARSTEVVNVVDHSLTYFQYVVNGDFQRLLNRLPAATDPNYATQLQAGQLTDEQVLADIVASNEYFQNSGSTNQAWFVAAYTALVGQAPSVGQINQAMADLQTASQTQTALQARTTVALQDILNTSAYQQTLIGNLFTQYLQRQPTAAELASYQAQITDGASDETLINQIVSSPEFYQVDGSRGQLPQGSTPKAVALADLSGAVDVHGQPIPDLILAGGGPNTLAIYQGLPAGGFAATPIVLTFPSSTNAIDPTAIAVADLNGDNQPDIVVTDAANNQVVVFLNQSANGVISFAGGVAYQAGNSPVALVAARLDPQAQSTNVDLAIADGVVDGSGNYDITILQGNGNGTLVYNAANVINTALTLAPTGIAAGDLNGDGLVDLALSSSAGLDAYFNKTTTAGTYNFPAFMRQQLTSSDTTSVAIGPLDYSKANDVVATANTVNTITSQLNQWASSVIDFGSEWTNIPGDWSASDALGPPDTFAYGDIPTAWSTLNIGGPPDPDHLTLGYAAPVYATGVMVRETNVNGFVTQVDLEDTNGVFHTVFGPGGMDPGMPGAPWNFQISFPQTAYQVVAVRVWVNAHKSLVTWPEIDAVQLQGVLVSSSTTAKVMIFQNPGGSSPVFANPVLLDAGPNPVGVTLTDLLGVGLNDILVTNDTAQGTVTVLRNRTTLPSGGGLATLSFDNPVSYQVGGNPVGLALGAVNRDGVADLVTADSSTGDYWTLLGHNDGSFQTPTDQDFINLAYLRIEGALPSQAAFNTANAALLGAEQVYLDGPHGRTAPLSITTLDPNTGSNYPYDDSYQINFAPQVGDGNYTFNLGPNSLGLNVADFVGNTQDQDQDLVNGQIGANEDAYQTQIPIATTDDGRFVMSAYQQVLNRVPTNAEFVAAYNTIEAQQNALMTQTTTQIVTSALGRIVLIDNIFQQLLGRPATSAELFQYWSMLQNGTSREHLVATVASLDEFYSDVGGTPSAFIAAVYQDLLNRAPTSTELTNALTLLGANPTQATRLQFTSAVVAGPPALQALTVTGSTGTFTLSFNGQSTTPLSYNASAGQVQAALDALTTIGGAGAFVTVTAPSAGQYLVTFGGSLGTVNVPALGAAGYAGTSVSVSIIVTGGEFLNDEVQAVFYQFLGRYATPAEVSTWSAVLTSNSGPGNPVGYEQLEIGLLASQEFFLRLQDKGSGLASVNVWLTAVYSDIRDQAPEQSWVEAYTSVLNTAARASVLSGLLQSTEYDQNLVTGYYAQFLLGAPTAVQLAADVALLQSGTAPETIIASILSSNQFFTQVANSSNAQWVSQVYHLLLRSSNPPQSMVNQLNAGTLTLQQAATQIVFGTPYLTVLINNYYAVFLGRLASPSELNTWVANLQGGTGTDQGLITSLLSSLEYFDHINNVQLPTGTSLNATLPFTDNFPPTPALTLSPFWTDQVGNIITIDNLALGDENVANGNLATVNGITVADVNLSATTTLTTGQSVGLVARYNSANGNRYVGVASVTAAGVVQGQIYAYISGQGVQPIGSSLQTNLGSGAGTIEFNLQNSTLVLYWNGIEIASATDTSLASGGVGLQLGIMSGVSSFSASSPLTFTMDTSAKFVHIGPLQVPISNVNDPNQAPVTFTTTIYDDLAYQAFQIRRALNLTFAGSFYQNFLGLNEKWLLGTTTNAFGSVVNQWYVILPSGAISAWNGGSSLTPVPGAVLDPTYWATPSKLYNAQLPPDLTNTPDGMTVSFTPNPDTPPYQDVTLAITPNANVGTFLVLVTANDGSQTDVQSFLLSAADQPPAFLLPSVTTVVHSAGSTAVSVTGIDDPDGDPLAFSADIYQYLPGQAYQFEQQFGLSVKGSLFQNLLGLNEKWLFGTVTNQWYVIQPNGNFSQWNGGGSLTLLGTLDASYWANPATLYNAAAPVPVNSVTDSFTPPSVSAPYPSSILTLAWDASTVTGNFLVVVQGTDGAFPVTHSMELSITDAAPTFSVSPTKLSVSHAAGTATLQIPAVNDADGDPVALVAQVYDRLPELAYQFQQQFGLTFHTSFYQGLLGLGEKWLYGTVTNTWYVILPNGVFAQWNGGSSLTSLGTLDASYWATPSLLYNAVAPAPISGISATLDQPLETPPYAADAVTLDWNSATVAGDFLVVIAASDGLLTTSTNVPLTITDAAPVFSVAGKASMSHNAGSTNVPISGVLDQDGDNVTITALVYDYLPGRAYQLFTQDGLVVNGSLYFNYLGLQEKWLYGTVTGSWYIIQPNGAFSQVGAGGGLTLIQQFDPSYCMDPSLLYNAQLPAPTNLVSAQVLPSSFSPPYVPAQAGGVVLSLASPNVGGQFLVITTGTDGILSNRQFTTLSITDQAPTFAVAPFPAMSHNATTDSTTVSSIDDADGDSLTFATPQVYPYLPALAYQLQQQDGLSFTGNFYQNDLGLNEKWLFGTVTGKWYVIQPNGTFSVWNGGGSLTTVATFSASVGQSDYWTNPALLFNAQAPTAISISQITANLTPNQFSAPYNVGSLPTANLSVTLHSTTLGGTNFMVVVSASDGALTTTQGVPLNITDSAPTFSIQATASTTHNASSPTPVTLSNISDADNDPVSFSATVYNYLPGLAYQYKQQYGLTFNTSYYLNDLGRMEKWVYGTTTGKWYTIQADGTFSVWNGGTSLTTIGTLSTAYWQDPTLLTNAQTPVAVANQLSTSFTPSTVTGTSSGNQTATLNVTPANSNVIGPFLIVVTASDGILTTSQNVQFTVTDAAPSFQPTPIADQSVSHTVHHLAIPLTNITDADGETVTLSANVYDATQAATLAYEFTQKFGLVTTGIQNASGISGNWLYGTATNQFYVLDASGNLSQWNGGTSLTAIASLGAAFASPGTLLAAAPVAAPGVAGATVSIDGSNNLLVDTSPNFAGKLLVQVNAADTTRTDRQFFNYTLTDQAPVLPQVSPNPESMTNSSPLTVTLNGTDPDSGDILTYIVSQPVDALASRAFNLEQSLGLHFAGSYYTDEYGMQEKWLQAANGSWYAILPGGDVHPFGGTSDPVNTSITTATLSPAYYNDPTLIFNAPPPAPVPVTATLANGGVASNNTPMQLTLQVNSGSNYTGTFVVTVKVADNVLPNPQSATMTFNVTVS